MIPRAFFAFAAFMAAASIAAAQDTTAPRSPASQGPMVIERVSNGFAGAPEFKFTELDGTTENLLGGYGGYLIDNTLLIGGGAYWLTSGSRIHDMGYGGAVIEWLQRVNHPIGYSVRGLIGFGVASLGENVTVVDGRNGRDGRFGRPNPPIASPPSTSVVSVRYDDGFFVAEPQANLLFNLNPKMRVGVSGGYRLIGGAYHADDRLRGATASVSVQFGGTSSRKLP